MKILFTGASSFTGAYFVRALAEKGHEVTSIFTQPLPNFYQGVRRKRVDMAISHSKETFWKIVFGSIEFTDILERERYDLVCCHGAASKNFHSSDFEWLEAVRENTFGLERTAHIIAEQGSGMVLTNTYFAGGNGMGTDVDIPITPFGLSKTLTTSVFRYFAHITKMPLSEFVMVDAFGPLENPDSLTSFLIREWAAGRKPVVKHPNYIRDNIAVTRLAELYEMFITHRMPYHVARTCPQGIHASNMNFVTSFAYEMAQRLHIHTPIEFSEHLESSMTEPLMRFGEHEIRSVPFDMTKFWDELAEYYREVYFSPGK